MYNSGFIVKDLCKLKTSIKFLKFQNSILGLSLNILAWNVIQKMYDGCTVNESVCIAKFEQQRVITIIKIFGNEPKFWWLDEKMFYYYMSVLF